MLINLKADNFSLGHTPWPLDHDTSRSVQHGKNALLSHSVLSEWMMWFRKGGAVNGKKLRHDLTQHTGMPAVPSPQSSNLLHLTKDALSLSLIPPHLVNTSRLSSSNHNTPSPLTTLIHTPTHMPCGDGPQVCRCRSRH